MFVQGIGKLSDDVNIAYSDSGPVEGSTNYTTIIIVHGSGFNAHSFEPLHDLAGSRNLRTIALQRRHYPGSTPFSDQELVEIQNGSEKYIQRTRRMMIDFIKYTIETLEVPPIQHGSSGIALVGWSFGTSVILPVLSNSDIVSSEETELLGRYLRSVFLYDSPAPALGVAPPTPEPIVGATPANAEENIRNFPITISSYYDHPVNWDGDAEKLDRRFFTSKATWFNWTDEEKEKFVSRDVIGSYEVPTWMEPMSTQLRQSAEKALFDESLAQTYLPNVSLNLITTGKTFWVCRWGIWNMRKTYDELIKEGKKLRKLKSAHLEECNHLAHFDHPVLFMDTVKSLL